MSSSSTTSPEKENMYGPCKVCQKPGNAIHYGAWTCDPCKLFFGRALRKGPEHLICYKGSNCDLSNSQPKSICAYCRFQKCLEVGMKSKSYQHLLNDSKSPEKENMNRPCQVCEKPGIAVNYRVWTCDPCKSFFARSLKRGTESLFCDKDSNCDLSNSQPHETCKYCRFQKCVKVGMKSKSHQSRLDGQGQITFIPKNEDSQLPSPSPSLQSSELTMEIVDDSSMEPFDVSTFMELQEINNIVNSYKEGCCFTADKINGFELRDFEMVINQNTDLARVKAWTDYAEELEADIRALLPFIDDLQDSFNSHDKAILLKRSAFQIYLLRRIRALNPYGLLLSDGRVIRMISLQFLYGIPLMNEMLQIVNRILLLGCTDEDVAMFVTMVYYKPGKLEDLASLNLQNPENLSPTQQKFKNLFVKHAESRGVDQKVFQGLIEMWPELERLKTMHQESLEILKPYRWAFPEDSLFAEVYDIDPKIVTIQNRLPSISPVSNGSI